MGGGGCGCECWLGGWYGSAVNDAGGGRGWAGAEGRRGGSSESGCSSDARVMRDEGAMVGGPADFGERAGG